MRAVVGGVVRDVAAPVAGPDEVAVRVHAAALSRRILARAPFGPGAVVAGRLPSGDRVLASAAVGGLAEVVVVRAGDVVALPADLTYAQGAALLVDHLTAYHALVERGRLRAGESVLVRIADGGLESAVRHVATAFGAARVLVGPADGSRVDLVVDGVGGPGFVDSLRRLHVEGRAVVLDGTPADIRVNRLLLNNIEVVGARWDGTGPLPPSVALAGPAPVVDVVALEAVPELVAGSARGTVVVGMVTGRRGRS